MATTSFARPAIDQGSQAKPAPDLALVPRRSRGFVGAALAVVTLVVVVMMASTVFHTRLAERQFELDVVERSVAAERARFDLLRRERAWMASPERLADLAQELGLVVGARTEYLDVPAEVLAVVEASTAGLDPRVARPPQTPLDDFRSIKHVLQVQP